jgi:hypothetical protein
MIYCERDFMYTVFLTNVFFWKNLPIAHFGLEQARRDIFFRNVSRYSQVLLKSTLEFNKITEYIEFSFFLRKDSRPIPASKHLAISLMIPTAWKKKTIIFLHTKIPAAT